mmetsp:Transcript_3656/g.6480  ORF Transcript_3656/g.6480 Transcript_3656/m.6480 type:complete len:101 (-) Transcript_3656:919-1221(-)
MTRYSETIVPVENAGAIFEKEKISPSQPPLLFFVQHQPALTTSAQSNAPFPMHFRWKHINDTLLPINPAKDWQAHLHYPAVTSSPPSSPDDHYHGDPTPT